MGTFYVENTLKVAMCLRQVCADVARRFHFNMNFLCIFLRGVLQDKGFLLSFFDGFRTLPNFSRTVKAYNIQIRLQDSERMGFMCVRCNVFK